MNRREAIAALTIGLPATAVVTSAKVEPDDVIVIECESNVSDEAKNLIAASLNRVWPGRKVVVLDHGLKLRIVKAADAPNTTYTTPEGGG